MHDGQSRFLPIRSASDLSHPELRELYELWKGRCADGAAPSREKFDVLELKRWLPHLQLLDVMESRSDVRYRVIGTWITERYGQDDTGKTWSEIGLNDRNREILDEFITVASSMTPYSSVRPFYDQTRVKEFTRAERLILPLSRDGRVCDQLLSGIYYLSDDF
ncbi:PAS domain-containing protein [Nisaea acidiphila]|uniref:PAS domain-containing protein n=1 Tax=Nisaea acidiphila TaxID=1862145 RepID=A0A9J7AU18_9PROT|nr:PAS domain-containing protein [Nisaea acidiphila]UUX49812.1 PAS domain-containing protein [Nisaea acidiphila]